MLSSWLKACDPDRIQTCNLLIRSQMLYSVEPRGLAFAGAKIGHVFLFHKLFVDYFRKNRVFYLFVIVYQNFKRSFIVIKPFLPAVNSAARTAPRAKPRRVLASCLMLMVSISDS
jgi:hypothetical protein